MFCKKCGYQLSDQARFCPQCGEPIEPATPPAPSSPQEWGLTQYPAQPAPAVPATTMITVEGGNGKRTQATLAYHTAPEQALSAAELVLRQNGFNPKSYHGESVWKKGTGMLTAMQYVKLIPAGNSLVIQGWIQIGVGDAGLKEQCLDGFVGAIPKKMVLKTIEQIRAAV